MSEEEVIGRVHGKNHTYSIILHKVDFGDDLYIVRRDDGKTIDRLRSRADAYSKAHDEAGPNAYES